MQGTGAGNLQLARIYCFKVVYRTRGAGRMFSWVRWQEEVALAHDKVFHENSWGLLRPSKRGGTGDLQAIVVPMKGFGEENCKMNRVIHFRHQRLPPLSPNWPFLCGKRMLPLGAYCVGTFDPV